MKRHLSILIYFLIAAFIFPIFSYTQVNLSRIISDELINLGDSITLNNDFSDFKELSPYFENAELILLGEQSHSDSETIKIKIKLIKFLHQEMGFEILAFEGGFYDCQEAWKHINEDENTDEVLASSLPIIWSMTKEFKPLTNYISQNKNSSTPLILSGFDNQFTGKISVTHYISDLKKNIERVNPSFNFDDEWVNFVQSLEKIIAHDVKKINKKEAIIDTNYINGLIGVFHTKQDSLPMFWERSLQSAKYFISDLILKTDYRDREMAKNLMWIKENNPNKKIICWGATSHFLYNSDEVRLIGFPYNVIDNYYKKVRMMGGYIKEKYKDKAFTVGFTTYHGTFGGNFQEIRNIKEPQENSLEHVIEATGCNNCFLTFKNNNFTGLTSRPLGHVFMKNPISNVMDAVIFNKKMNRVHMDYNLYFKIYPNNNILKRKLEKSGVSYND